MAGLATGVNQGRTSNQFKTLFHLLTKGNSLKNSSTYGIRTSQVGVGSGSEDCIIITGESRGDVTCDSLGDVIWNHGTHDVKRSVGKVRRIWMRKQHQESQNRIVMSTRGFLLLWFRIKRNRSSD